LKIDFVCSNPDFSIGTFRILVHDFGLALREIGHDVQLHRSVGTTRPDAVVIYGKGDVKTKVAGDSRISGAISLSGDSTQRFDFSIVNSIEEKKSVEHLCQETVIVNLVERMYEGVVLKQHKSSEVFKIGYHGSYTHLSKLGDDGFADAFRTLALERGENVRLSCVTNDAGITQQVLTSIGIPMDYVDNHAWRFETAKDVILQSDVGILPNMTPLMSNSSLMSLVDSRNGIYNTDYAYRFKNKSNPGRSFVFIQLGIPVITDLTPSMMPMYYDEKCGAVATTKQTWLNALDRFRDPEERTRVAVCAASRFKDLYNIKNDANNLIAAIERIKR
jgi:hypothetical protein